WGMVSAENLLRHRRDDSKSTFNQVFFKNTRAGRFWALEFNQQTLEMRNVQVDSLIPDGSRRVFVAEGGYRSNDVWCFFNARQHTDVPNQPLPTNRIITNFIAMPEFTETPEDIKSEIKINEQLKHWKQEKAQMPLVEIIKYLQRHPKLEGQDRAKLYTLL